ncbi:hypothetical protein F2P79_007802 [Pimephales promelas]|nr:hypothetical protein F2P79_007802 [Pimephales promelas]
MSVEAPDLSNDPEYRQRLQYLGDEQQNCTVRLSHVTLKDSQIYYCRFITDRYKWTGKPGVTLTVTDLQVESPERVTEGDSVSLTCKSSCALTDRATFIWYRNSLKILTESKFRNTLILNPVRREDSGRYSCAVDGHTHVSPDVHLNVMYPPRSVSVSIISPSGVIFEGDSVTLNCISDSNPPAGIHWFKGGTFVGSGRIFSISKIRSDDSGEYKCRSFNEYGEKYSDTVTLNVMNVSVSIISPSGVIVEGDSVTLKCISDSNPPAGIRWFKGGTIVGSGRIFSISKIRSDDSGEYKCRSFNKPGEKYSDPVNLNVMNVSVSIIQSGQIWAGDSVTLKCISDSNPPAVNFSWFKENESSAVGSGQSFSALQSGRFYCQAHNQHGSQRSDASTTNNSDGISMKSENKEISYVYENVGRTQNSNNLLQQCPLVSREIIREFFLGHSPFLLNQRLDHHNVNRGFRNAPGLKHPIECTGYGLAAVAMVTSVRLAPPLPLIFLLMIHGVSSADWGVSYSPLHICALNDSTVIMNCTYTYPTGHQIEKVFWSKTLVKYNGEFPDLSNDPEYSQRLQYLGDKQQDCTVRLSHVTLKDSHMYYFRFITDKNKWIGAPGVSLTVTDLQVESPERVTEGDSVSLTCKSSCALTDRATFIWYRNSLKILTESKFRNTLILNPVRREDSGRYSCAVDGHTHASPDVHLNVMYPPRNVSVSISPSGVIVEGDSVTLNCISDSNPPALNFSWFKGGTIVGSGRIFNISKIRSDDSGEYKCKSINEHGEKYSDTVTLNDMFAGRLVILYISIGAVCGAAVIIAMLVIWISRWRKKRNDTQAMMNHPQPDHERRNAYDVELSDPVYENVTLLCVIALHYVRKCLGGEEPSGGEDPSGGQGGEDPSGGQGGEDPSGGQGGSGRVVKTPRAGRVLKTPRAGRAVKTPRAARAVKTPRAGRVGQGGEDPSGGQGAEDPSGGQGGEDPSGGQGGEDPSGGQGRVGQGGEDPSGGQGRAGW